MIEQQCIGTNLKGERCKRYSKILCEFCGNPVCPFHNKPEKHDCEILELNSDSHRN